MMREDKSGRRDLNYYVMSHKTLRGLSRRFDGARLVEQHSLETGGVSGRESCVE
jgi:hypothetical protein